MKVMFGVVPDQDEARRATFERMYRTHYRAIERYVHGHFPWIDTADVMSHTFEAAWRRLDEVPPDATRGWLVAVARNWALNGARSLKRRDARTAEYVASRHKWAHELHQVAVPIETREALISAMQTLSPADREVLLLATWNGLSGPDLGEALAVSAGAAAVRLFRARQRLRDAYNATGGGEL